MRIAAVVSTFPPYRGGMGNIARELAVRTTARGHAVVVVTPRRGTGNLDVDISDARFSLRATRSVLRAGNAAWCPGITEILAELNLDLVHLHWPFVGGVAPVLVWRRQRPQHRLVVQYHMDLLASGWRRIAFAMYAHRALPAVLRAADRIVVSSMDYAERGALAPYVEYLGDRLLVIPLGVDATRFSPSRSGGERAGVGRVTSSVLFVGGLDRAHAFKGVPVLLAALSHVPDVRLRIVGDGDLRPTYERQAQVLGIADRVEFLGVVPDAALPDVYRAAEVLVLPSTSRSEAFGLVLLEAMASGLPVIASDLPGVRTVVVDGETGFLVPTGDVGALAARLAQLAHDPALRERMGAAGRRRVEERSTWERIVDQWVQVYRFEIPHSS